MEEKKIIEIYMVEESEDKVSMDIRKVEDSKEANKIMNMLMKALNNLGIGRVTDVVEEDEEDEDIIEDKGDRK